MKKILLLAALTLGLQAQAQFKIIKLGAKGGLNYPQASLNLSDLQAIYNDPTYAITDIQTDISNGFNAGLVGRIGLPLLPAYIQGEALYTQFDNNMTMVDNGQTIDLSHTVQRLDFPISAGAKMGPLFAGLGATPSIPFSNASDIWDDDTQANFTWGWHIHGGVKLWKLMAEIKYEGGFGPMAQNVNYNYNGTDYNFALDSRANQLIVSVAYFIEN